MDNSQFRGNDKDFVDSSTDIYDALDPIIKKKVKESMTFQKILKLTKDFMTKNANALATNIIGRRVLVSQKMEDDIYSAFGLDKNDVKKIILESRYFKETFGRELSLTDQLCLGFPLILASLEYKRLNKMEESELCYLLAHFKPYSSRESLFFKFGVKEGQMLYTIEKSLSERFDIKKYGTIINVLKKRAQSSYSNYIQDVKASEKMTDKTLYVCYTSGIAGAVNTFIGTIVEVYRKNEGKTLDYEASAVGSVDGDTEETEYNDADIQSDVAIKNNIVRKTLIKLTKNPVDKKLVSVACQNAFNSSSLMYINMMTNVINEITDNMFKELPDFFNALIASFLFHTTPSGDRTYTMEDFYSPIFLNVGVDILAGKKSNVKDKNLLKCREIFKRMLNENSVEYVQYKDTAKRTMEKALACYWVYLLKSTR